MKIPVSVVEVEAYKAGYDCGKNGANTVNCNWSIFSTQQRTEAWQRGKRDAEQEPKGEGWEK